ncbi:ZMYM6 neighbor, partial [Columba livia]
EVGVRAVRPGLSPDGVRVHAGAGPVPGGGGLGGGGGRAAAGLRAPAPAGDQQLRPQRRHDWCHLHAAGAAGAPGHVRPRHALPRPPPAAQHPRARRPPQAEVRVTGGRNDGRLGWREAMLLQYFGGRRGVSSPAAAGCHHAAGPRLVLWDGGDVTGTTLAAPLLSSHKMDWSSWNGHARLGLA